MTNSLITTIGKQLNIPISDDADAICRIVYSVSGLMALTSLWDRDEMESSISIQYMKRRMKQIFDAYEDLLPGLKAALPSDKSDLTDNMYSIYRRIGYLYHSPNRVSPALPALACNNGVTLYRGSFPGINLFMSGLGLYSMGQTAAARTVADVFGLQSETLESYISGLLDNAEWNFVKWPDDTEFLRLDPPFHNGYWQPNPIKDERVSLARFGSPRKVFAFYRYKNGSYQQKAIPEWRVIDFSSVTESYDEYRRIATALLKRYGTLPTIKVKADGELIEVRLGYRLPPSEEAFFLLYSWPLRYNISTDSKQYFRRKMARQIYPLFKRELETIGYSFQEE